MVQFKILGYTYDVVVDDALPYYRSRWIKNENRLWDDWKQGNLVFARNINYSSWFVPFIEKAAAKFYGTYSSLNGGFGSDAW